MKWFLGFYCRIVYWGILGIFGKKPSKRSIEQLYDLLTELMNKRREFLRFLNYGYHDSSIDLGRLLPQYDPGDELYSSQLYTAVITERFIPALGGKRLLEVGCGRGGGIAMIHGHMGVTEAVGLDISSAAVDNCRKWYQGRERLSFVAGDACQLPFADGSMDAIINVESAHGYPDSLPFFAHVGRVLAKGGLFFFADFMPPSEIPKLERIFANHNLDILERCDITTFVLEGIRLDQRRKMDSLYSENIPKIAKKMLEEFMGREGTFMYRRFSEKSLIYVRYVLIRGEAVLGQAGAPS